MRMPVRHSSSRDLLAAELECLQKKNHRFSMRAFARILGLSPSYLNQVLSGKRVLSIERAKQIARQLKFEADYENFFLLLVTLDTATAESRPLIQRKIDLLVTRGQFTKLPPGGKIADIRWEHLLLLVVLDLKKRLSASEARAFGKFLGMKETGLQKLLDGLVKAGLVRPKAGAYARTHVALTLESSVDNDLFKEIHIQYLIRLAGLISSRPTSRRYSVTEFHSIPIEKFPLLRQRTEEFLDEISSYSESGGESGVVELSLHLNGFDPEEVLG